jgi:hypothetical protein
MHGKYHYVNFKELLNTDEDSGFAKNRLVHSSEETPHDDITAKVKTEKSQVMSLYNGSPPNVLTD